VLTSDASGTGSAVGRHLVLLEHESLRDRFIRIVGATNTRHNLGSTTRERLSATSFRSFPSTWLWLRDQCESAPPGRPAAMLWARLRRHAFVRMWGGHRSLFATALSLASIRWSLAASTLAVFIALDIIAAQFLSAPVRHARACRRFQSYWAIFWSSLWGLWPGPVHSTDLMPFGRRTTHEAFASWNCCWRCPTVDSAQRFYQRALAGDPHEIIANARAFLKAIRSRGIATVSVAGLASGTAGRRTKCTRQGSAPKIRRVIVEVVTTLNSKGRRMNSSESRAVLDEVSAGRWLRQQREALSGRWQGPLGVPSGSVVLCLGVGSSPDDLAAELLVRLLRVEKLDARHFCAERSKAVCPRCELRRSLHRLSDQRFPSPARERSEH